MIPALAFVVLTTMLGALIGVGVVLLRRWLLGIAATPASNIRASQLV
jgi:hypothetical protein